MAIGMELINKDFIRSIPGKAVLSAPTISRKMVAGVRMDDANSSVW